MRRKIDENQKIEQNKNKRKGNFDKKKSFI